VTPEGAIVRAVLDYLAAEHILAFRQNTGAMASEYKGKKRFMRFGVAGMADVLAFPLVKRRVDTCFGNVITDVVVPTWIEVKAEKGKQSDLQKSFQALVEGHGHRYVVIRSIEDLKEALRA
jgi:hypothetical protein